MTVPRGYFDRTPQFELGLSENPFPPLPSVLAALNDVMANANRYPEFLPDRLPRVIARRIGAHPDQIIVGSGATGVAMQTLQAVFGASVFRGTEESRGERSRMVFAAPTFDGYPIMASIVGVDAVAVPLDSAGRQNLSAMAAAVDDRTGVVVVCRPHNPTGTLIGAAEFEAFLRAIPEDVVVILDEAYVEFVRTQDTLDTLGMIRKHPNLLILRTFSKAFGLAGLRIGYAFGAPTLTSRIRRWQLPFGVNSTAVAAVTASYAAEHELHLRVARITAEREHLRNALQQRGIRVPRSHANFLYLSGHGIAGALEQAGIVVKSYPDGSARIAVGDPAASRAVLRALASA
ncbi:aminotransferase class I/II-fold pyridoxal phosphate-dependent enzyme [Antrihabitans cavernicola]|uniref:Aminotransferase class I/II-fold pyridoxal phosphate-dependent enzyme n=1 Tax=Antrihabitans cavernicola TaxID=2495913 RepID=A0A5A7SFU3_9NOCA|nr:aminotransferase class I/II-fold pyridoxal phosphate-dependent enzyme [Spelaeibacter cavernicola]KAA0025000.1 aminotransferase class I/II-fold pyridoxal phosphate-dependent enzyme [Spelaeibacter cavernicola]